MVLLTITPERLLGGFSCEHLDAVTNGAALPRTLTWSDFCAERNIQIAADHGRIEPSQPLEIAFTTVPLAFLDDARSRDLFSIIILESELRRWALLLGLVERIPLPRFLREMVCSVWGVDAVPNAIPHFPR